MYEETKIENNEMKFFKVLKDIFIGEKIEGESGYINLMKIKSKYFDKIFQILKKEIEEKTREFPEFKKELFDKLYNFFKRYFSESGSVYFRTTPFSEKIYEKVYTDDRDVIMFWKTHMLYYVKSDRMFKNMNIQINGFKFFFDASKLEHKKAWEKREVIFELKEIKEDGTIVFSVSYSERGKKTGIEEILKELRKKQINLDEETLEKAFRTFEKQSEVDYFINKNARQFLKEQFDLWLYQYVYYDESQFTEKRIRQLKVLKEIAYKIIDFIAQFEDELVKIWNKPKFVLNSNYVITLDRIAKKKDGMELIKKIVNRLIQYKKEFDKEIARWKEIKSNKNSYIERFEGALDLKNQIVEWYLLDLIDESFDPNKILIRNVNGKGLNPEYQFLPIDTKYFKDLELEILKLFDNLDQELDGWLIKSENYQALNTILPKFKEKVQTIYIDPPFNKEQDADYFYTVKFKDATWITMLENRIRLARELLKDTGSIFVRCDYNGNMYVRLLLNEIFGEENFRNEIVVNRVKKTTGENANKLTTDYDNLYFYSKNFEHFKFIKLPEQKIMRTKEWHSADTQGKYEARIFFGIELYPPTKNRGWFSQEKIDELISKKELRLVCRECDYIHLEGNLESKYCPQCKKFNWRVEYLMKPKDYYYIGNNWTTISGYTHNWNFPTENSEIVLKRVIESASNEGDIVLDFFLGSGTTTATAHKLKRKWIGIEMGEHFYTVVLPRMKIVLAYDKSGISKEKDVKEKYNEKNAGGFFKYYELEQYEDTLRRVKYEDTDPFFDPTQDPYNQYIFMKDPKLLEALEIDYQNNKVKVNLEKLYKNIYIAETLSNLLGKWIKKITEGYVEFEDGTKVNIKELDYKLIKPLIWWN